MPSSMFLRQIHVYKQPLVKNLFVTIFPLIFEPVSVCGLNRLNGLKNWHYTEPLILRNVICGQDIV